jgi:hypothetical protein
VKLKPVPINARVAKKQKSLARCRFIIFSPCKFICSLKQSHP